MRALEIAVAALYLVGAGFNATYTVRTLRNAQRFYGAFADGTWLAPARCLLQAAIIPHARSFTLALIAFQLTMAILILLGGNTVQAALIAGAVFSTAAALVSNPAGTAGNLGLAALQAWLAAAR